MIKAIIFDIDGVLLDSLISNWKFFQEVFRRAGLRPPLLREYKPIFHKRMVDVLADWSGGNKQLLAKLTKIALTIYNGYKGAEKHKVMPHSTNIIKLLHKQYRIGLVTSRLEGGVEQYYRAAGTKKYVTVAVYSPQFKHPKPHPESILLACKKLHIQPTEALYVGDSVTDIEAAHGAGMKIVFYNKIKKPGADVYIKNLKDLPKAIRKLTHP